MTAPGVLFNPGPVQVHPDVWTALATSDLCHREVETLSRLQRVREKLLTVCRGDSSHSVVILTGSGTCALEAAIATAIPASGKALVIDNGNYGERMRDIVASRGLMFQWLELGWGEPFDLGLIERALAAQHFTHVLMAHHETSTGMLNPLSEVTDLTHRFGCQLIVDAVSSIGAEDIDVDALEVDWLVGSSNKCLEGLPGMSFVCAKASLLWDNPETTRPGLYLDLFSQFDAQEGRGEPTFTPAVQILAAWECALDLLLSEGVAQRGKRYASLTTQVRERLHELGLTHFTARGERSCCTSVFRLPEGIRYRDFHDQMRKRGYIVYHCPPRMGDVVRIATMGQLTPELVDSFLEAVEASLTSLQLELR